MPIHSNIQRYDCNIFIFIKNTLRDIRTRINDNCNFFGHVLPPCGFNIHIIWFLRLDVNRFTTYIFFRSCEYSAILPTKVASTAKRESTSHGQLPFILFPTKFCGYIALSPFLETFMKISKEITVNAVKIVDSAAATL